MDLILGSYAEVQLVHDRDEKLKKERNKCMFLHMVSGHDNQLREVKNIRDRWGSLTATKLSEK